MDQARVIQVVETTLARRGDGVTNPIRVITQYWSLEGELLAEVDIAPAIFNASSHTHGDGTQQCQDRQCGYRRSSLKEQIPQMRTFMDSVGFPMGSRAPTDYCGWESADEPGRRCRLPSGHTGDHSEFPAPIQIEHGA